MNNAAWAAALCRRAALKDRKSTRLNSSHTEIYTLSLHDALPILRQGKLIAGLKQSDQLRIDHEQRGVGCRPLPARGPQRSEEHTSELQSHRDLHSFPTRRSSDLTPGKTHRRVETVGPAPHRS